MEGPIGDTGAGRSSALMHNRRRRIMKTLITALAFAIVIVAPGFTEPADALAAARKTEPAACKLIATAVSVMAFPYIGAPTEGTSGCAAALVLTTEILTLTRR